MVLRLIPLIPALSLLACGQVNSSTSSTENKQQAGKSVYQKYCVACHGSQGDLGLQGAPNLKTSALNEQARIEVITHGRGVMPAYDVLLTQEEIASVAQYTLSLK